ncbi:MAG: LexA family protein [Ramlibacter sp.]
MDPLRELLARVSCKPLAVPPDLAPQLLLYASSSAPMGFPSPAEDFATEPVDVMKKLMPYPQSMFLLRVKGDSMHDAGVHDGDVLVVSKAIKALHGHLVIALINDEFTVKHLSTRAGRVRLKAANPTYPDIVPREGETLEIWAVATGLIRILIKV